jgi:hypothetical protein
MQLLRQSEPLDLQSSLDLLRLHSKLRSADVRRASDSVLFPIGFDMRCCMHCMSKAGSHELATHHNHSRNNTFMLHR